MEFLYIAVGILTLVLLLTNLYWGTFLLLLIQPLLFASWDETGISAGKVVYGVIFAVWFGVWLLSRLLTRNSAKTIFWHPMARPTLAFGGVLVLAVAVGLVRGNALSDIIRDLALYVGYLAVLPIIDIIRKPGQAKKIVLFLGIVGFPSYILSELVHIGMKQDIGTADIPFLPNAQYYWGPIQGAFWAVALAYERVTPRIAAWFWLIFCAWAIFFSGYRGQLLAFFGAGAVAIFFAGKLGRHFAIRLAGACILGLILTIFIADAAGVIKISGTDVGRSKLSTLFSGKSFYQDNSAYGRILEIQAQLKTFAKSPIVGVGLGYNFIYRTYDGSWYGGGLRTHNGYTDTLMKFGVLGTVFFAWYFIAAIRMALSCITLSETFFSKAISFGTVIWFFSLLVLAGSWGDVFAEKGVALPVGVMAGLLPALANQQPQSQEAQESEISDAQIYTPQKNQPSFPKVI